MIQERRRQRQEDALRQRGFFPVLEGGRELWVRGDERYTRSQALMVAFQEASNPQKPEPLWGPPPLTSEERRAAIYWKALTLPPVSPRPEWKPVYLRFGELPEGGRSLNHRTARFEAGVAAFRAYETCEGEYLVDLQGNSRLALILVVVHYAQKRPAFVLEGQPLKRLV